jgi:nucleotide-binding universal stress UspA family protein
MQTIVVGYDETEPAKRALARAAELAAAFHAEVVVISVARALTTVGGRGMGPVDPVDTPELHREELRHAAAVLGERGVAADYQVALGEPADAILELAEQRGADMIVVGTREPGLISRLFGLSVSGAVQRRAHCDVLIVH